MVHLLGLWTLSVVWYYLKKQCFGNFSCLAKVYVWRGETHFICILTYFQSQDGLRDRFI